MTQELKRHERTHTEENVKSHERTHTDNLTTNEDFNVSDKKESSDTYNAISCLIDLNQHEKIYTHVHASHTSPYLRVPSRVVSSKRGTQWNEYPFKPVSQKHFEKEVRLAISTIAATYSDKKDLRPRLFDKLLGRSILLDTGACCSVWPKEAFTNVQIDPSRRLQAVN